MPEPLDGPLPRGRHNLTREQVAESQRRRILYATIKVVAQLGYSATSVGAITAEAGVSRKSFYEQFADKDDCFLAAFDLAYAEIGANFTAAIPAHDDTPTDRLRAVFEAFFRRAAQQRDAARMLLVEIYAAGPEMLRAKRTARRPVVELVGAELQNLLGDIEPPPEAAELLTATIIGLATERVALDDWDAVAALRDPVVDFIRTYAEGLRASASAPA